MPLCRGLNISTLPYRSAVSRLTLTAMERHTLLSSVSLRHTSTSNQLLDTVHVFQSIFAFLSLFLPLSFPEGTTSLNQFPQYVSPSYHSQQFSTLSGHLHHFFVRSSRRPRSPHHPTDEPHLRRLQSPPHLLANSPALASKQNY